MFRAVSDPTRRAILDRLRLGSSSVGDLAARFPMSRPAISKHLRLLREARLVAERRRGRSRIYALRPEPLAQIDTWLKDYRLFWASKLHALKHHVESDLSTDEAGGRR